MWYYILSSVTGKHVPVCTKLSTCSKESQMSKMYYIRIPIVNDWDDYYTLWYCMWSCEHSNALLIVIYHYEHTCCAYMLSWSHKIIMWIWKVYRSNCNIRTSLAHAVLCACHSKNKTLTKHHLWVTQFHYELYSDVKAWLFPWAQDLSHFYSIFHFFP